MASIETSPEILVVEDEAASRRALTLLLKMNGYTAAAVGSAEEALLAFERQPWPGVALVDLDLPGMSGLELISRLQSLGAKVHAVLITAADADRVRQTSRGRAVVYMQKPLNFETLLKLLHERLGHD